MLVALYMISTLLLRAHIAIDICMCVCVFVGHTSIHVSICSADPSRGMGGGKRDAASPRRTVAISIVTFCLAHPMRMSAETKKIETFTNMCHLVNRFNKELLLLLHRKHATFMTCIHAQ